MTFPTEAVAFKGSKDGKIVKSTTRVDRLEADEVLVELRYSGFCGTDLHYTGQEDMVLGHEGTGIAVKVGSGVTEIKAGDRVGFGYIHNGCGDCKECRKGDYGHCHNMTRRFGVSEFDQGSFATHAVWKARLLFKIPEAMSLDEAAPLMCAGITVFNPLTRYNIAPTSRVGVVGVGGLGHLAIQFAAAWGCEVVVFSGTDSKKEEALKLGAKEFISMKGKDKLEVSAPIDHLLVTSSYFPDWDKLMGVMAPFGTVYPMSVDGSKFELPFWTMLGADLAVRASTVGSKNMFYEMLDFAVRHNVRPMIQKFPLTEEGVTAARQALENGQVRYRVVFDIHPENEK